MTSPVTFISLAGERALKALHCNAHGNVLSSHATGLYIRLDDGSVLLMHDEKFGIIPFGLGCAPPPDFGSWKVMSPGGDVGIDNNRKVLRICSHLFSLADAVSAQRIFPEIGMTVSPQFFNRGMEKAADYLNSPAKQGIAASYMLRRDSFFGGQNPYPPFENIWENALWKPLQELLACCLLSEMCSDKAEAVVAQLIGLGPGLTPLADDILCAFLATSHTMFRFLPSAASEKALHTIATAVIKKTNGATTSHSQPFLESAAAGEHYGIFDFLVAAILSGQDSSVEHALKATIAIGYSSGSGYVLGTLLALHAASQSVAGT